MSVDKFGKILVADDHEITRRGVRELIAETDPDAIVIEAYDGASCLRVVDEHSDLDLVLLDVNMPGSNVVDTFTSIRARNENVPVLVLTALTEVEYIIQTMKVGAAGFVQKHQAADELLQAMRTVLNGGVYLHPESAAAIASSLHERKEPGLQDRLSDREKEVFRLIALGRSVKEIAYELSLSDKTVSTYLTRIREKTGLSSHVEIARYALKNKLVD